MEQVITDPGTGTPTLSNHDTSRRQELANFLRSRRQTLLPSDVGLPKGVRRRVKGLRREEVAEAAGISVAWYTWMEQGRDLNLSENTVEKISQALHLNPQERAHLYQLADHPAPLPPATHNGQALDAVHQMIRSMNPHPAYALDPHWNIVAYNEAAQSILFGDIESLPKEERNFMRLVFTSPRFRSLYVNWEEVAHCSMAHFRSDSVTHVADHRWLQLIDDLNARSPEFREWWPHHNVAWPHSWKKELRHPSLGTLHYNTLDLELFRPARLRIVTYTPAI